MNQSTPIGKDRPNVIPWPPILVVISLVAGYLLSRYLPLPWLEDGGASGLLQAVGALLILTALLLIVTAIREFRKARTSPNPTRAAAHLVTGGPYRFSRNPIYLGNVLLLLGIGAVAGWPWFFPIAIINGIAEHRLAVVREEAHLEHVFGRTWRDYKKRVRAWI